MTSVRNAESRIADATVRQLRAADPERSVWVSANAGSGKTRVLTNRVIRLLLSGTEPERILCLTYTKAAAAEMAGRLFKELGKWASYDDATLSGEVRKLTGGTVDVAQLRKARRLFASALETPGGLKIQTIHAFCESLLGRFPLEAGIPARFEVMDERLAAELLDEARNTLWQEIAEDPDGALTKAFSVLISETGDDQIESLLDDLAGRRADLAHWISRAGGREQALADVYARFGLNPDLSIEGFSRDYFHSMEPTRRERLEQAAQVLAQEGGKDDQKAAGIILDVLAGEAVDPVGNWLSAFLTKEGKPRSRGFVVKAIRDGHPMVAETMDEEQQQALDLQNTLRKLRAAGNTKALLTLGFELAERFEQSKKERGLLDFADLILHTRTLLERPDVAPWVMYKLDGGIDHILVDEAQDTSPDQWAVIKALADEFFQGESARDINRTIFAVGDEKQSIYSFQGAAPEQFATMRSHFQQAATDAERPFEDISLNLSFRSLEQVLDTVDRTFTDSPAQQGLSADGRPVQHEAAKEGFVGLVEFWPLEEPEEEGGSEPWDIPLDRPGGQSPMIRHARKIADTIAGWLSRGETRANGTRITPGDILVLVKQRTRLMDALIRAFKERNIPVAGADRMRLTEQLAVMDLMALARFVLLPQDDLTLAAVLKSPLVGLSEEDLFTVAYGRAKGESLWQALTRQSEAVGGVFREASSFLHRVMARADVLPTFEFFAALLNEDGGRRRIVARLGQQANDPLDEFLSLTLQYEQTEVPSLQGLLRWLDVHEAVIKRDMEQQRDEVRVMTVHGAKGLEAPIVFMPDMCSPPVGRSTSLFDLDGTLIWGANKKLDDELIGGLRQNWEERQRAEYHRLLYVGLTRAEDRLYLSGHIGAQAWRKKDSWYELMMPVLEKWGQQEELAGGRILWRIGEHASEPVAGRNPGKDQEQTELTVESWALSPPPAEQAPVRPLAPSKPLGAAEISRSPLAATARTEDDLSRFQRGNLIHGLLERLPAISVERRMEAGQRFLERQAPDLTEEQYQSILSAVLSILDNPDFSALFGPGSFAEAPLAGHVPELGEDVVISARIDRLVITETDVLVVDYKSNRPPPETPEEVSDVYVWQMASYRAALRRLYPDRVIKCALLWTDVPRLMPLPDALMDDLIARRKKA